MATYVSYMTQRKEKKAVPAKPANLRSWRVIIMRSRGEHLGSVEALS